MQRSFLTLYSGHTLYDDHIPHLSGKREGQRAGEDEKENKPEELYTVLRGNQVSGLTNKGHRYRSGLQTENECDMKINPHRDEAGSLCPEKQELCLQCVRPAVRGSSLRMPPTQ